MFIFYKIKLHFFSNIFLSNKDICTICIWFDCLSFPDIRLAPLNNIIENYTVMHIKSYCSFY